MKYFLIFLFAALLGLTAFTIQSKTDTVLSGKVTDESGEVMIGAIIRILKGTDLVIGTMTDTEGNYRVKLEPGVYNVESSYTGYETRRITEVEVLADQVNTLDIVLASGTLLEEVVVVGYEISRKKQESKALEAKPADAPSARFHKRMAKPAAKEKDDAIHIKGAREEAKNYYIDGIRISGEAPAVMPVETMAEPVMLYDRAEAPPEPAPRPGIPGQPAPRAGLLTAGEWNDLHNWNTHWVDLLKDGELDAYQKMYGFYPRQHYSVLLTNDEDFPLPDVPVALYDRWGGVVWETRTDNTGKAELWANLFQDKTDAGQYLAIATVDGKKENLGILHAAEQGLNRHRIRRECQHPKTVDIVWTVDATGSMGDELEYLKTELLDVIGKVKAANPDLGVRMGSVFYRDKGDDYIVKSSALNHDIAKTVDYIRKQSAGGGGDYPEAVHSALEEAIFRQPWSREAIARICFLVLDASPHQEPEVLESLQKSIREAAKQGIRIVPVSASGIQKDTEFLMKFFGLATNGSYVFLTDHSGIGGKHLEPTTDEYKVELLNDLLVRLITEYTTVPSCEGKAAIRFADQQNPDGQQQPNTQPILYYPNPAVSQFSIELPFDAQKVTLYDAGGNAVRNLTQLSAGLHTIAVQDLPPGFYTLRVWKDGQVQSGKVMVVRA